MLFFGGCFHMQKHNIRFEEIPNLSSIIYLVLTLRPMLTSSCMLKCPHCALTFCDLLNERTPPPPKKSRSYHHSWLGAIPTSGSQGDYLFLSGMQRISCVFSLFRPCERANMWRGACLTTVQLMAHAVLTLAWYQEVCWPSASSGWVGCTCSPTAFDQSRGATRDVRSTVSLWAGRLQPYSRARMWSKERAVCFSSPLMAAHVAPG